MVDKHLKTKLRQAYADALLDALAKRLGFPSSTTEGAGKAMAKRLGVHKTEISRARTNTAVTTLMVWAAELQLCVIQNPDGTIQVIDPQPSEAPTPAVLGRVAPTTENP